MQRLLDVLTNGRPRNAFGAVRIEADDLADALQLFMDTNKAERGAVCWVLVSLYRKGRLSWQLGEGGAPAAYLLRPEPMKARGERAA